MPLSKLPLRVAAMFREWRHYGDGRYLCGNCYFDVTDDEPAEVG